MESLHAVNFDLGVCWGDEVGQWRELDKLNEQRRCWREREASQILSACDARLGERKMDGKAEMYFTAVACHSAEWTGTVLCVSSLRYDNCLPALSDKRNHWTAIL